jgi:signal transduction histidine kinase
MASNPRAPEPDGPEPGDRLTEGGGSSHDKRMDLLAERVASLEGTLKGVSWALGLLLAALLALVGSGGVFLVFQIEDTKEQVQLSEQRLNDLMDRLDFRIDGLAAKVDALPGQLTAIANSIANAITATRQQPVIITLPPAEAPAAPGSE